MPRPDGKHYCIASCKKPATINYGWDDDEGRVCFAWFCQAHYEAARDKYQNEGKRPDLDLILFEDRHAK